MSMMILFFLLSLVMATLFTKMIHPLSMGVILFLHTLIVCVITGLKSKTMWMPYILAMIFLGAMLVLFMYVASLAPNEIFFMSPAAFLSSLLIPVVLLMLILNDNILSSSNIILEASNIINNSMDSMFESKLSIMYTSIAMYITLFIILYLLLTLVVVVKLTYTHMGPLRMS